MKKDTKIEVCDACVYFEFVSVCSNFNFLSETGLKFRALKKPAQLAVINSLEKVIVLPSCNHFESGQEFEMYIYMLYPLAPRALGHTTQVIGHCMS